MNTRTAICALLFLLAGPALRPSYAYQDGDVQIWHTEAQEFELSKGWKMPLEEEFRYGDGARELYYQHYEIGITRDVNAYLALNAGYRQIYDGEKGKFKPEFQPNFNITPKYDLYGFMLEDRNRLELRFYDDNRADAVEYRNRLLIRAPWKFTVLGIQPYVSEEVFVRVNGMAFRRNRFAAGVTSDMLKGVKGDIYYMLQSTKRSGVWTDANILGLKLKISF